MVLNKEQSTISLEQAQNWITRWKEGQIKNNIVYSIKAFLIPGIDLKEVLAEEGVQDVRSYIGVDEYNKPHLLIVGVDAKGNDMINKEEAVNLKKGWYIYDFTVPCPNTCDVNSPLFSS